MTTLKNNLIGDRAFYQKVVAVLLPIVIQNAVTNIVSLVDNVMVGAVGTLQMSAVAIVNQLLFIFYLCIFGGLAGAGIFAAQYAGAGDNEGIKHCFRIKFLIALAMSLLAIGVFLLFDNPLISMYFAEDTDPVEAAQTLGFAKDYLLVMLFGLLPFGLSQTYGSTLREMGETKLPMIASLCAIGVNLAFNYVLIFGSDGIPFLPFGPLGVVGAAIATVLSRFVEAVIIILYVHRNKEKYPFIKGVYRSFKIPLPLLAEIGKKGSPLLLNEFLWSLGMAMLNQCYSARGLGVVAATNIATTANNLFNVVFLSMGNAIAIMAGQQLGAGEYKKAKITVNRLLALSVATCLVMGGLLAILAPYVPLMYKTTAEVRSLATSLLYVTAILMPVYAFCHGCYFTMRSGGKTVMTFAFDCGFTWLLSFPTAFILSRFTGMPMLEMYVCVQSIEIVKSILGFILVQKGVWINNIVSTGADQKI